MEKRVRHEPSSTTKDMTSRSRRGLSASWLPRPHVHLVQRPHIRISGDLAYKRSPAHSPRGFRTRDGCLKPLACRGLLGSTCIGNIGPRKRGGGRSLTHGLSRTHRCYTLLMVFCDVRLSTCLRGDLAYDSFRMFATLFTGVLLPHNEDNAGTTQSSTEYVRASRSRSCGVGGLMVANASLRVEVKPQRVERRRTDFHSS